MLWTDECDHVDRGTHFVGERPDHFSGGTRIGVLTKPSLDSTIVSSARSVAKPANLSNVRDAGSNL